MDLSVDDMIDAALTGLPRGRRGNPSTPPTFLRDIKHEDLALLASPGAEVAAARPITRIRAQHHLAARLIAEGRKPVEVAGITGYTPARIVQLRADPAFCELVSHYKGQVDARYLDVHARLALLGTMATEELQERLEEDAESFSNEELRKLAETTLDRGGYGPNRSISVESRSVSVHLVEAIKAEAASRGQVRQLGDDSTASDTQEEVAILVRDETTVSLPLLDLPTPADSHTTWAPDGPFGGDADGAVIEEGREAGGAVDE